MALAPPWRRHRLQTERTCLKAGTSGGYLAERSPALTSPSLPARRACKLVALGVSVLWNNAEARSTTIGIAFLNIFTVTPEMTMEQSVQTVTRSMTRPVGHAVRSPALTSPAPTARRAWILVAPAPSLPTQVDKTAVKTDLTYIDIPLTVHFDGLIARVSSPGLQAEALRPLPSASHITILLLTKLTAAEATSSAQLEESDATIHDHHS